jgi:hypothetical protein
MKWILSFLAISLTNLVHGQLPSSEIFLFDLKILNGQVHLSNGKNITNHKGYDNQPFFHPSQPIIYYSSSDDSNRTDLKYYNYKTGQTSNLTVTREKEYSPTVTPDEKFISCIIQRDNEAQDLAKFPIEGGNPRVLVWHLKIGYHAWADNNRVFLFVLDDSVNRSLHNYDLANNADTVVAGNIGRSLHKIPGEKAMSFTQKVSNDQFVVKKYNLHNGVITTIINGVPGQDQLCWLKDRVVLTSDGSQIFFFRDNAFTEVKDRKWQPVVVETGKAILRGVTRLAADADNTKLAVVVSE